MPYKNSRHEGTFRTIILANEEDSLKPNKSYYIAKGRLDRINPNYYSIHKEVELTFTYNTIIKATWH
ncbi:hypothetical protein H5410_041009 [Solanum commersonii]|uniref:Uncharacterized protein n=1 Tax=Solanum commersonii TaxID=4109 RepID=A0A9J5XSG2_SOLCO|nr:hypothetical protein H5410_041009 [Solanum commersonii]